MGTALDKKAYCFVIDGSLPKDLAKNRYPAKAFAACKAASKNPSGKTKINEILTVYVDDLFAF